MKELFLDSQSNNSSVISATDGNRYFMYQTLDSKIKETFGELPKNCEIKEFTEDYCIFVSEQDKQEDLGLETIRFKVEKCYLEGKPDDTRDKNDAPSEMTMAMRHNNNIVILEGRHRAVYAYQGGCVPPSMGGVVGKPNILEYSFDPTEMPDNFFDGLVSIEDFKNYINPYKYTK
ncbi:hypothetical protein ACNVED_15280 (plasmid) [Legionella sp. D16C41]|uniref:hypothetical protein n=1 Tax=Legionella sp. D16C41 TaxID=3402688 RepID=UPI003AF8E920